jgi:hypothetical protein
MKGAKEYKPAQPTESKKRATLVQLSSVVARSVLWLWFPYIPLGKLTLLEGDPSAGKTWLCLALAASITKGFPFLDQNGSPLNDSDSTPRNVVYLTAEDGLDDTLKPRFDSMGGDATRLYALTGASLTDDKGKEHDLAISLADIDVLDEMLEQVKPALVVVDPIQAFLGAGIDMHRANEVRPLLTGISKLAEKHECAFVLIRHLGKSMKVRAMYSGLGSIDFAAAARSVLLAGEYDGKKLMAHVKSSLAPTGKSMNYSIGGDNGFTWDGVSSLTAEDLRAFEPEVVKEGSGGSLEEASEWLRSQLVEGALPAKSLLKYAKSEGISERSLRRAKQKLNVQSRRENRNNKGNGEWLWFLESNPDTPTSKENVGNLANVANLAVNTDAPATLPSGNLAKLGNLANTVSTTLPNNARLPSKNHTGSLAGVPTLHDENEFEGATLPTLPIRLGVTRAGEGND